MAARIGYGRFPCSGLIANVAHYAKGAYTRKPNGYIDQTLTGSVNIVSGISQGLVGLGFGVRSLYPRDSAEYRQLTSDHMIRCAYYTIKGIRQAWIPCAAAALYVTSCIIE